MAELIPAPFADLVSRLFLEPQRQDALFELPRKKWYLPAADAPDLSVAFHGQRAGNPSGPAAGPHTQMAQNLLLSYVAGGRILELKTVQVNDRLTIGRPCIDVTNVGYNIEWSQELLVEQSLREYVAGAMLIEMFRRSVHTGRWGDAPAGTARNGASGTALDGPAGDVIYDISVGYDLAGIRSDKVRWFLDGMRDARAVIEDLRSQISNLKSQISDQSAAASVIAACDLPFPTRLSSSITLSTFHGCPADEIERICEFLIGECDFDVIVKMNPPTLGREKLEHLLHDVLGYKELTVNPTAYASVISFDDSVQLCRRLTDFAQARGRRLGFKFSNTLEVINHRDFFTPDNKVMYLSGQPLHVITLTLTDEFRRAVGPDVPISFSAGIDRHNFATAVACGFVPITSSTDLLRPGGYARLGGYLESLTHEMKQVGAANVDEFVLRRFELESEAQRRAVREGDAGDGETRAVEAREGEAPAEPFAQRDVATEPARREPRPPTAAVVRWAGLLNTTIAAEQARNEPRYRAERNRTIPKRIDSHLWTFDCITCYKCLPVCPNAANFLYPTPKMAFDCHDIIISPTGHWRYGPARRFAIDRTEQIACYADFCNHCGNCDTFCPEYGGPYIKKPTFHGSVESWQHAAPRDGFVVGGDAGWRWIRGRMQGREFQLAVGAIGGEPNHNFTDGVVSAAFGDPLDVPEWVSARNAAGTEHTLDMWAFHVLRHLLAGVLDRSRINQINAGVDDHRT